MGRIYHVMKKEFIQTFRDRRMVMIIFVAPLIQLFIIGYAISTDVKDIKLGVMDQCRSESSRKIAEAFARSGYFIYAGTLSNETDLRESIYRGDIDEGLVIPVDYDKRVMRGEQANVQLLLDATDSNFAQIAGAYSQRIFESISVDALNAQFEKMRSLAASTGRAVPASAPVVEPVQRVWYNPELKSVYAMVPGIISMILMVITMMLTGMAVTRERELGTIEQVIISPIASWELILGKLIPFGILGFIDVALIVAVAVFHFKIPLRGSLVLLFFSSGLFLFTTLGLGLFFSTISRTQQQAMFVNFMFMMPAILLSGFMFPIENMPDLVQYLTYLNPQRYFLVVIRGIFLKGSGVDVLWPQLSALAGLGLLIFGAASLRFRRNLV
jgi:ABC-2 type transport system permease protein